MTRVSNNYFALLLNPPPPAHTKLDFCPTEFITYCVMQKSPCIYFSSQKHTLFLILHKLHNVLYSYVVIA
jgi:hypothetical protein